MSFVPYNLTFQLFNNFLVTALQPFVEVAFQRPCNSFRKILVQNCLCSHSHSLFYLWPVPPRAHIHKVTDVDFILRSSELIINDFCT